MKPPEKMRQGLKMMGTLVLGMLLASCSGRKEAEQPVWRSIVQEEESAVQTDKSSTSELPQETETSVQAENTVQTGNTVQTEAHLQAENREQMRQDVTEKEDGTERKQVHFKNELGEVILGDYRQISYQGRRIEITEEQVEDEVQFSMKMAGAEKTAVFTAEGTVRSHDVIRLRYAGYASGEAIEGLGSEDEEFTLGEGVYPVQFEENLIGLEIGKETTFTVTFPEDDEEMPGQTVQFTATVLGRADGYEEAKLTDEWVRQNTEYASAEEYRKAVRERMERQELNSDLENGEQEILKQLVEISTFTLNPEAVEKEKQLRLDLAHEDAEEEYQTYEEFVRDMYFTDVASFEAEQEEDARWDVCATLAVEAVIHEEQVDVSEEAFREYLTFRMKLWGCENLEAYYKDMQLLGLEEQERQDFKDRQVCLKIREMGK